MTEATNPLNLRGIEFIEYASPDSDFMEKAFYGFGFSKTKKFKGRDIEYFNQNDIHFLLNNEQAGFSREFAKSHGPAISSMGCIIPVSLLTCIIETKRVLSFKTSAT